MELWLEFVELSLERLDVLLVGYFQIHHIVFVLLIEKHLKLLELLLVQFL